MASMDIKAPCGQHCPRRCVGCRDHCAEWAVYAEKKAAQYHERAIAKQVYGASPAKRASAADRLRQRKRGRK